MPRAGRRNALALWLVTIALLTGQPALSEDMVGTGSSPTIQLVIKPRLCFLNAGEDVCRDELEVKWSSTEARSVCLYQAEIAQPLHCWDSVKTGEYQFTLMASASTDIQLCEENSRLPLSSQRFQVVHSDKKYRKVRRNPWSFF